MHKREPVRNPHIIPEDINEPTEKLPSIPAINKAPAKHTTIEMIDMNVNFSLKTILPINSTITGAR